MSLEFKTTSIPGNIQVADRFGTFGAVWEISEEDVDPSGEEGPIAEDIGWHFGLSAPGLTRRQDGPFPSVMEAIKAVQDTYGEFADERAREQRFDHRQGKRVVSIPSGGQPR